MKLTDEQQAVVEWQEDAAVVQACPGSGKSTTLAARQLALPDWGASLTLVFNKEAQQSFLNKLGERAGASCDAKTFHAFALKQIMRQPSTFGFKGRPQVETGFVLPRVCAAMGEDFRSWDSSPWDVDLFNALEMGGHSADIQMDIEHADPWDRPTMEAVLAYRRSLMKENKVTFNAMVRLVAQEASRMDFSEIDHFQIDEFQDVDQFQWEIATEIAQQARSAVVVGDPWQRIYGWRGALADAFNRAQTMLQAKRLPLLTNFRSSDEIIGYAEGFVGVGMRGVRGSGRGVEIQLEGEQIKLLESDGPPLKERAILCRTNALCWQWFLQLALGGTPVDLAGREEFWQMPQVKLVVKARGNGQGWHELMMTPEWARLENRKRYREDEDALNELRNEAKFLLGLSNDEWRALKENLGDANGVKVSTIHKAKGCEWKWVMIPEVSQRLRKETCVWYVGITRAMDRLILQEAQ